MAMTENVKPIEVIQKVTRPKNSTGVIRIRAWWLDINDVDKVKMLYYPDKIIILPHRDEE